MGMNAALKMRQIVENVEQVLAIELLCAAQGLDYRKPLKPGKQIQQVLAAIRKIVPRSKRTGLPQPISINWCWRFTQVCSTHSPTSRALRPGLR